MTIPSPQQMTIPTNTVCHSQLIYGFIRTQHANTIHRYFLFLICTPNGALSMDLSIIRKIPISLSFRHHASLPYNIAGLTQLSQTAPFSLRANLLQYSNSPHSLNLIHQHLVLAVTAASHTPPTLILPTKYVNPLTVSTSSHNVSSCPTASPILSSHFLHVKFLDNF